MSPHILRHREIVTAVRFGVGLAGLIKLTKGINDGHIDANSGLWLPGREIVTFDGPQFPNIITNLGLDNIADNPFSGLTNWCHCGTGTATEAAGDTALQTFLASTNSIQSSSSTAQGSAPYYGRRVKTFRFGEGAAEGNVAELGFSSQSGTGQLFSRARVKDGGGSPTTITVQSDEWLDVTYEFRLYPDHILSGGGADDGTGTIDISGDSYDYVIRPCRITDELYWRAQVAEGRNRLIVVQYAGAYATQTLGAATGNPGGTVYSLASPDTSSSQDTYSNGTYNRDVQLIVGIDDGNVPGGVGSIEFWTGLGSYQMSFDPVVPKDATKVWTLTQNLAWTRATIP